MKKAIKSKAPPAKETWVIYIQNRKKKQKEEEKKIEPQIDPCPVKAKDENTTPTAGNQNLSGSSSNSTPQKKETEKNFIEADKPSSLRKSLLGVDLKPAKVEEESGKKVVGTKSRPTTAKPRYKQPKKEIGKIGGMRGKLGIVITEDRDESKDEIRENETRSGFEEIFIPDENPICAGRNSASLLETHGTADQPAPKEPALDELSKLYSKLEKSKNPADRKSVV